MTEEEEPVVLGSGAAAPVSALSDNDGMTVVDLVLNINCKNDFVIKTLFLKNPNKSVLVLALRSRYSAAMIPLPE